MDNRGNAIVVEFVGPPGSGKTTNCSRFYELLTRNNFNVFILKDVREYFHNLKSYKKLVILLKVIFSPRCKFSLFIFTLAAAGIISLKSISRYYTLCAFNLALEDFIKVKDADVILLDQWIIQGLWSSTIFRTSHLSKLPDRLNRFYFETDYVLYFQIDSKTASGRIKSRDSGKSRFDLMNEEKRLAELNKYNGYLFELFNQSSCTNKRIYSTMVPPLDNAIDFLHQLQVTSSKHQSM